VSASGRALLKGVAVLVAGAAFVCATAVLATGLRLRAAGLPFGHGLFVVPVGHSLLVAVVLIAVAFAAVLLSCAVAYGIAWWRWEFHGRDWDEIVARKGVGNAWSALNDDAAHPRAPIRRAARDARAEQVHNEELARRRRGVARVADAARLEHLTSESRQAAAEHERRAHAQRRDADDRERGLADEPSVTENVHGRTLLQIIVGFNLLALAGTVGLAIGSFVSEFASSWWVVVPATVVPAALVFWLLTALGPLHWPPRTHAVVWAVVAVVALISSPPVALLLLSAIVISTVGRPLVRTSAARPDSLLARARLPLLVGALYTLVGIAYYATAPVSFDGVVVRTASGTLVGGSLARSGGDAHVIACTPLADATSTGAYIHEVRGGQIAAGEQAVLDPGKRPSLAMLALGVVGIDWPRALILPSLRARKPTCAGAAPAKLTIGHEDPALGAGAIVGPPPPGGRTVDGEPPIEQTADPRIAHLARLYQPTVELTVADRFWPVSVGALLADVGPGGQRTCLVITGSSRCVRVQSVPSGGQQGDYLRFPTSRDPLASALSQNPLCGIRHNGMYVESMIMLSTSCANRISPAHAQLTFNIIKRQKKTDPQVRLAIRRSEVSIGCGAANSRIFSSKTPRIQGITGEVAVQHRPSPSSLRFARTSDQDAQRLDERTLVMLNALGSKHAICSKNVGQRGGGQHTRLVYIQPGVNLSAHRAPIVQPSGRTPQRQCANR
jgi:hypothetical protein